MLPNCSWVAWHFVIEIFGWILKNSFLIRLVNTSLPGCVYNLVAESGCFQVNISL